MYPNLVTVARISEDKVNILRYNTRYKTKESRICLNFGRIMKIDIHKNQIEIQTMHSPSVTDFNLDKIISFQLKFYELKGPGKVKIQTMQEPGVPKQLSLLEKEMSDALGRAVVICRRDRTRVIEDGYGSCPFGIICSTEPLFMRDPQYATDT
jgi:hypothetical protein